MAEPFQVQLLFKGRTVSIEATLASRADELIASAVNALHVDADSSTLKLLYKGKRLEPGSTTTVFTTVPKKAPKLMVLATNSDSVQELNSRRSDPTIRGFDQTTKPSNQQHRNVHWGPDTKQDKNYKFCRFQACDWQSFGHRPSDSTPHDFAARELLEQLATDPGVVAVLKERELVVGTLGEMDPIDDRLMRQKQTQGACLLGYNTNGGQRIDIKLRTDDLKGFRPYPDLVATLIHELSHNWVGEHNLLFWTNFGQMRAEYLVQHTLNNTTGFVVNGKTTAQLAGLPPLRTMNDIYEFVMNELARDMASHGLHPSMISAPIRERCLQLEEQQQEKKAGVTVSGGDADPSKTPREMALAAAERRAKDQEQDEKKGEQNE